VAVSDVDRAAFAALLKWLDSDQRRGEENYEFQRRRLILFLASRQASDPERLADVVMDRAARKVASGESIAAPPGPFLHGVARMVLHEDRRAVIRHEQAVRQAPPAPPHDADRERRLGCLDHALDGLDPEDRRLVLDYHRGRGGARIARRRALALRLGVSMTALRLRMHRLRQRLERSVVRCLEAGETESPGSTPLGEG
jgi:hypothetical protein